MKSFKVFHGIVLLATMRMVWCQQASVSAQQPLIKANDQPAAGSNATATISDYLVRIRLAGAMDALAGMEVVPAEEVLRIQLGLADRLGLVVTTVQKDGPAATAEIQVNDVLTSIEKQDLTSVEELDKKLKESRNQPVKIELIRAGKWQTVELTPREASVTDPLLARISPDQPQRYWLGVALAGADATLRSQLNIPDEEGLVVTNVEPDGPASKAGVMVNDVLLKLDNKTLKTIEEIVTSLQHIEGKSVALELIRRGKPASLTVTPEKRPQATSNFKVEVQTPSAQALFFAIPDHVQLWDRNTGHQIPLGLQTRYVEWETPNAATANAGLDATRATLSHQLDKLLEQTGQLQASLNAMKAQLQTPTKPVAPKPAKP